MRVKINPTFSNKLLDQVEYIARDKPEAALKFYLDIEDRIHQIPSNPYKYRKSIFSDQDNVRDMVFKGYVITFRILSEQKVIEVFSFYKYQKK
ncbi:MAG: type II toxin-antitoxin system RelE/ParE family toxin [Flavobacteriales bacterium]